MALSFSRSSATKKNCKIGKRKCLKRYEEKETVKGPDQRERREGHLKGWVECEMTAEHGYSGTRGVGMGTDFKFKFKRICLY